MRNNNFHRAKEKLNIKRFGIHPNDTKKELHVQAKDSEKSEI